MSIAPFQVAIVPINVNDERVRKAAEALEAELEKTGVEVLLDDRDDSPGVKFKDVDLIGVPIRIVIGDKTLSKDSVELKLRREEQKTLVPVAEAATRVKEIIERELARIEQEAKESESRADGL